MKASWRKSVTVGANGRSRASALLDDQVYRRIYEAIGGQELPPGTRLREDQMRQIFGVSRARIRKVFSRLAFEGLVQIEPNRGASVARGRGAGAGCASRADFRRLEDASIDLRPRGCTLVPQARRFEFPPI